MLAAAVAGAALVICGVSAASRSPRLERLALNAADMQTARAALLRASDLAGVPPGWRPLETTPDDSAPPCPWQDYSRLTLSGRAQAGFQAAKVGASGYVGSTIDIYASRAQAQAKFEIDTHAGTVSCEAEALRKAFGSTLTTVAARQVAIRGVGERGTSFQFVYSQTKEPRRIFVDVIELVRGRGVATVDMTNFDSSGSAATRLALVHAVDGRLG